MGGDVSHIVLHNVSYADIGLPEELQTMITDLIAGGENYHWLRESVLNKHF